MQGIKLKHQLSNRENFFTGQHAAVSKAHKETLEAESVAGLKMETHNVRHASKGLLNVRDWIQPLVQ